jgi:amino acid transporter
VIVDAVFFALTGAALIVLRRRRPAADRPVKAPLYPFVPAAFVALQLLVVYGALHLEATRTAAWIGLCWIVAAVALHTARFRRARPHA